MPDFSTRHADQQDVAALAQLGRDSFVEAFGAQNTAADIKAHCEATFSMTRQAAEIADTARTTVVTQVGDELVGYGQILMGASHESVPGVRPAELCRLYVLGAWHGRGVAQAIMEEIFQVAAQADVLWLGVWEDNPRGIAFYKKYGFEAVGRHTFYLGSDPQQDLVMARRLPDA